MWAYTGQHSKTSRVLTTTNMWGHYNRNYELWKVIMLQTVATSKLTSIINIETNPAIHNIHARPWNLTMINDFNLMGLCTFFKKNNDTIRRCAGWYSESILSDIDINRKQVTISIYDAVVDILLVEAKISIQYLQIINYNPDSAYYSLVVAWGLKHNKVA